MENIPRHLPNSNANSSKLYENSCLAALARPQRQNQHNGYAECYASYLRQQNNYLNFNVI